MSKDPKKKTGRAASGDVPRVNRGVPQGGQFAASQRDESGISLNKNTKVALHAKRRAVRMLADEVDEHTVRDQIGHELFDSFSGELPEAVEEELDRRAADVAHRLYDPEGYESTKNEAALKKMIHDAYGSARHWERAKGVRERSRGVVGVDDLAQDGLAAVLRQQDQGYEIRDPKGYAHTYIWGKANQAASAVRQEDRKALKILAERIEELEGMLGRKTTDAEQEEMAASIRENWHDPQHRPSKEFRHFAGQTEVSVHASDDDGYSDALLHRATMDQPDTDHVNWVEPGSFIDRSLDAVEGHNGDKRAARRLLWNALAEGNGVPLVQPGTLSQRRVTAVRADMFEYGGGQSAVEARLVVAEKRAEEAGEPFDRAGATSRFSDEVRAAGIDRALTTLANGQSDAGTAALLSPWKDPDADSRDAIVSQMRRYGHVDSMWDSALRLANTRNATK